MKPNISLFDLPGNGFGILFSLQTTCYVEGKREENSTYTAVGNRGQTQKKWRENHGHVVANVLVCMQLLTVFYFIGSVEETIILCLDWASLFLLNVSSAH